MSVDKQIRGLLRVLPIATTPPRFAREDEAAGLGILGAGLGLGHVYRVTERLTLADEGTMQRAVAVDVDLRRLEELTKEALEVRDSSGEQNGNLIWVPVARYSRQDLSPVVIRNASGEVVTTLTHRTASDAIVAGLARLIKQLNPPEPTAISSNADAKHLNDDIGEVDRAAEWLLLNAVSLAAQSVPPETVVRTQLTPMSISDTRIRRKALLKWKNLADKAQFEELLEVASNVFWVVVALPGDIRHHHLTFEAPLLRDLSARPDAGGPLRARMHGVVRRGLKRFIGVGEYTVRYTTQLPREINSYHVNVEVPPELKVRRLLLSSNADDAAWKEVQGDARALQSFAVVAGQLDGSSLESLYNQEERALATKTALLLERRHRESLMFREYLRQAEPPVPVPEIQVLTEAWRRRRQSILRVDKGRSRVLRPRRDAVTDGIGDEVPPRDQSNSIADLSNSQIGRDVYAENDPREHGAHSQWRQEPLPFETSPSGSIQAEMWLTLSDEEPALLNSVQKMLLALIGVVGALCGMFAWLQSRGEEARGGNLQTDAIVAVLLIVPGVLLARLDIPQTHSLLAVLRTLPRNVAYLSVVITSALAVFIAPAATEYPVDVIAFAAGGACLFVLLVGLEVAKRALRKRGREPLPRAAAGTLPKWLCDDYAVDHRARGTSDAKFEATFTPNSGEASREFAPSRATNLARRAAEALRGSNAIHYTLKHYSGTDVDALEPNDLVGEHKLHVSELDFTQFESVSTNSVCAVMRVSRRPGLGRNGTHLDTSDCLSGLASSESYSGSIASDLATTSSAFGSTARHRIRLLVVLGPAVPVLDVLEKVLTESVTEKPTRHTHYTVDQAIFPTAVGPGMSSRHAERRALSLIITAPAPGRIEVTAQICRAIESLHEDIDVYAAARHAYANGADWELIVNGGCRRGSGIMPASLAPNLMLSAVGRSNETGYDLLRAFVKTLARHTNAGGAKTLQGTDASLQHFHLMTNFGVTYLSLSAEAHGAKKQVIENYETSGSDVAKFVTALTAAPTLPIRQLTFVKRVSPAIV